MTKTKQGYMESFKDFTDEGMELVMKVKSLGENARATYKRIGDAARELAHKMIDGLNEFKLEMFKRVEESVTELEGADDDQSAERLTRVYFERLTELRKGILERSEQIEALRANPTGMDEFQKVVEEFRSALDILVEYGKERGIRIPWQICQCCEMDPDGDNPTVEFDGGRLIDADGNNIMGAVCYSCADEIQDGIKGEGVLRYKCLDVTGNINQCESCYKAKDRVKRCLLGRATNLNMLEFDQYWNQVQAKQNNIDSFLRFPVSDAPTISLALHNALKIYEDRPFFGMKQSNSDDTIAWMKYSDVHHHSIRLGVALKNLLKDIDRNVVGICSRNRPEWLYSDFACTLNGFMTVGIHIPWPIEDIEFIIGNAEITCIICEEETIHKYLAVASNCPTLKYIVLMDKPQSAYQTQVHITDFETILNSVSDQDSTLSGISLDTPITLEELNHLDEEMPFVLMYSSGTSGKPKGITLSKAGYKRDNLDYINFNTPNLMVSYAALGHGMDRGMIWQTLANGGQVVFCPHESQLIEYCQRVEPTILVAFPQFWNMYYAEYVNKLKEEVDQGSVLQQFSTNLGSRLQVVGTGGSPTAPEVFSFMEKCFAKAVVINSYGLTEIAGISNNGVIRPDIDLILRDVPSMGYLTSDKPYSRGEILVKSSSMTTGYYRQPELSTSLFDERGYICTGDIGLIDDEGKLHLIDRVTNFIEIDIEGRNVWIPGGELESMLLESEFVSQIYIHGDRIESSLIAVVVPPVQYLQTDKNELKKQIIESFKQIVSRNGLPDYCTPRAIIVEDNKWTVDSGLITVNGKARRHLLQKKYKTAVDMEYGLISLSNRDQ